jgi:hypothetical protein
MTVPPPETAATDGLLLDQKTAASSGSPNSSTSLAVSWTASPSPMVTLLGTTVIVPLPEVTGPIVSLLQPPARASRARAERTRMELAARIVTS